MMRKFIDYDSWNEIELLMIRSLIIRAYPFLIINIGNDHDRQTNRRKQLCLGNRNPSN